MANMIPPKYSQLMNVGLQLMACFYIATFESHIANFEVQRSGLHLKVDSCVTPAIIGWLGGTHGHLVEKILNKFTSRLECTSKRGNLLRPLNARPKLQNDPANWLS